MYDVVVVGGGPAGMSAAMAAYEKGSRVLLIERENHLGGILKQCIHDGFGLLRYGEMLTGPEYALMDMEALEKTGIDVKRATFVTDVGRGEDFELTLVNGEESIVKVATRAIILANGCRERTAKQIFINGTRPAGVYTAGTAQYLVNMDGYLPCKRCVILGSGDIGLIMARRLTLEGAEVVGVYEAKDSPSGLRRNVVQCLEDYNIPLHLSRTVTRVYGRSRVEAVEVMAVDEAMTPIEGTEEVVACDGVILSVGLIPENELAETLGAAMDGHTKGPLVNQDLMTSVPGVFSCGNALHVNDLVDYVSESGQIAGSSAAAYAANRKNAKHQPETAWTKVHYDEKDFLYVLPQRIRYGEEQSIDFYVRVRSERKNATLAVDVDGSEIQKKKYRQLSPPEMEKISLKKVGIHKAIQFRLEGGDRG